MQAKKVDNSKAITVLKRKVPIFRLYKETLNEISKGITE